MFICNFRDLDKFKIKVDWVYLFMLKQLSVKFLILKKFYNLKKKNKCKLMLDATASIGLEKDHNKADVMFFSSCKRIIWTNRARFYCL